MTYTEWLQQPATQAALATGRLKIGPDYTDDPKRTQNDTEQGA